jgi:hypothetical protein
MDEQSFLIDGKVDVNECLRTLMSPRISGIEIIDSVNSSPTEKVQKAVAGISSITSPRSLSLDDQSTLVDKLMSNLIEDVSKKAVTNASSSVEYLLLKIAVARYVNSRV